MAPHTTDEQQHPLAHFGRLSPSVYIQEPDKFAKDASKKHRYPRTIILAFWMNAPPRALAKYVLEYKRLAPTSRIIFLLSSSHDFILRATQTAQRRRVMPAVQAIRASCGDGQEDREAVFLHMFSNGGVSSTAHLLAAYKQVTGRPLRVSSMMFDSAPGAASVGAAMRAFSFALPKMWVLRILSRWMLWTILVVHAAIRKVTGTLDAVGLAQRAVNDGRLITGVSSSSRLKHNNVKRCYIYSDVDELVDWRDVERHADEAEASGWMVRREKFVGSPHVSHMRVDPERYWGIVKKYLRQPRG